MQSLILLTKIPHKPKPSLFQFSTISHINHHHHHHHESQQHKSITTILHSLIDTRHYDEAHRRFSLFLSSGLLLDHRTSNLLLSRLLHSNTPHRTWSLILSLFNSNSHYVPSLIIYNRLMHQFCTFLQPHYAHRLFFDMVSRGHVANVVTYTTLVNGYCAIREIGDAWKVFDEMLERGVEPNSMTYSVLIRGVVVRRRDLEGGRGLMEELWERMRVEREAEVKTAAFANLVDSLCGEGFFNEVFRIAEELPFGSSLCEEVAYGQMIDSLCKVGRYC